MSAVSVIAEWSAGVSDDAGARDPASIAARRAVAGWGVGVATVVGDSERRPAPWAALANGTAVDALDFDDYDIPAASHPSAVLVPALLALGEERGASGRSLLDAYIVGIEVQLRLGEALNLSHFHKGFHPTATIGTLAASVACARLIGLDAVATGHALSIATSLAAGSKCQLGTTTIHLHTGLAAHNGVLAASLAAAGATGSVDALDGEFGILRIMADADAPGFDGPLAKLGDPLAIVEYGLCVKPYPCCSYTTPIIDGLLALRSEHGFTPDEVDEVIAHLPAGHIGFLKFPDPADELEARFSMEYCLAVALHRGAVVVADFTPVAIAQQEVRALMSKVRMEALGEPTAHVRVVVRLGDGRTLDRTVEHPRGSAAIPFTEDELVAKFDSCVEGVLAQGDAVALRQALLGLESLEDVTDLTRHLNPV